jgi:hypothetical protein
MDQIIPYKFSSFSIRDVASRSTLPTPQALRPNTFNNGFEANLTKGGFGSGLEREKRRRRRPSSLLHYS